MDLRAVIKDHTDFIYGFFKQIVASDTSNGGFLVNAVVSPISVSTLLAMAAAGAKGDTFKQIVSCLRLPPESIHDIASQIRGLILSDGSAKGGPFLCLASAIWVEQNLPLRAAFKETVHTKYAAAASPADFVKQAQKSREEINTWVKDQTMGKILEILPSQAVDHNTKSVLVNALYFKGAWQKKFQASETIDGDFHLLNGQTVKVPMMTTKEKQEVCVYETYKVLRLPYSKGEDMRSFSMYVILPDGKTGLDTVEKSLSSDILERILVQRTEVKVGQFKLPRFKLAAGYELQDSLQKLGMVLPFSDGADFSDMVDSPVGQSLYISNTYHKVFLEVNEEGTEAAAATAAVVQLRSIDLSKPVDFVADHPFVFVLKEDTTGIILFIGHVVNPLVS